MANIIEETWFIGVMAGVGALIVILIIVIVVLCCLWYRKKKDNEENVKYENNNQQGKDANHSNDQNNSPNWVLVQPNDKFSVPSSSKPPRIIRGDEATVAGSSLIHMDKEMRANGVHYTSNKTSYTQTIMESSLERNKFVDAFDRNGDPGRGPEIRGSHMYHKPRLANIAVSSVKKNESNVMYTPERNTPAGPSYANSGYRIPDEDYDDAIVTYGSDEITTWNRTTSNGNDNAHGSKVKEMATSFENRESTTVNSPMRATVQSELKELEQTTAPIKKRLSQRYTASNTPQKRVATHIEESHNEDDELQYTAQHSNWQVKSGKSTIETRVNRIKKIGAVSVFPD